MIELCAEEAVFPEHVFFLFLFFFAVGFIIMAILEKKSKQEC